MSMFCCCYCWFVWFGFNFTQETAKHIQLALISASETLIQVLQLILFFFFGFYKILEVGWQFISQTHFQKKASFEMFQKATLFVSYQTVVLIRTKFPLFHFHLILRLVNRQDHCVCFAFQIYCSFWRTHIKGELFPPILI